MPEQKLSEIWTFDYLMKHSFININLRLDACEPEDPLQRYFRDNDEKFETWFVEYKKLLEPIADAESCQEQILRLRQAQMEQADLFILAKEFLDPGFYEQERETIAQYLSPGTGYHEFVEQQHQTRMFTNASLYCLRCFSLMAGDAHEGDWFEAYADLYRQLTMHALNSALAEQTGRSYPQEEDYREARRQLREFKSEVLHGLDDAVYAKE